MDINLLPAKKKINNNEINSRRERTLSVCLFFIIFPVFDAILYPHENTITRQILEE